MKRVAGIGFVALLLLLTCCGIPKKDDEISFLCESGLAYVTEEGTVYCVNTDGTSLEFGENVGRIAGWNQLMVLLLNDGIVRIYDSHTGNMITSHDCINDVEQDSGTGNGSMEDFIDTCKFFEENSKVEELIYYREDCFAAKVNGEWLGPAAELYPDVSFDDVNKMVGIRPHEPDFVLYKDGSVISTNSTYHDYKNLLKADIKYADIAEGFEAFFLGNDGKVYSQKDTSALEWENVKNITAYAEKVVGVDKTGKVLLESETSRHAEEVSKWKDVNFVDYEGYFLVGVDKNGNVLATNEAVEYFSLDIANMPKVRVGR